MVRDGGASYIRMCRVRDWVFKKPPCFQNRVALFIVMEALRHYRRIFIGVEPDDEMCPKSQDFEAKVESCCGVAVGRRRDWGVSRRAPL